MITNAVIVRFEFEVERKLSRYDTAIKCLLTWLMYPMLDLCMC